MAQTRLRKKYGVPEEWDIGFCIDDKMYYFIKLRTPGLVGRLKPEGWRRWIRKNGELDVAKYLVVDGILYLPYRKINAVFFRKVVREEGLFRVVVGGWLV